MAEPSESPGSIQPLGIGDVVSAGFRLYRAKSKDYLKLALFGTLWALLPYAVAIALVLFFAIVQNFYALLGLLIPALIVLFLFCIAKFLAYSALISRLAFGELTNQPEPINTAQRYTDSRKWQFLGASVLLSLIYLGVGLPLYLLMAIVIIAMIASMGGLQILSGSLPDPSAANLGNIALLSLVFLALLLVFLAVLLWLGGRLVAYEVPLAVEPEITATQTIGRMWGLTKGKVWRIVLILIVTALITLPLQILAQLISELFNAIVGNTFPPESFQYNVLSVLIASIVGLSLSIIVLPLWQTIKAVIYYDLRSRREGLGLQLRDRDAPSI